ncbi:MAG: protein-L-isoaspartate(D-aspartate) O-methyltransferase [Flavobacteriales bacterium]
MIDTFKHKGLRNKMVDELRVLGISDEQVLTAINNVPRHWFLDNAFLEYAYQNKAFPIGSGQTISHPFTVAYQTQLLEIKKGEKVLEVGTGCGYQTSVLMQMGAKVFSIERQQALFVKTKKFFAEANIRAKVFYGDGYQGIPVFAPYDKVIVTAGAPYVPEALIKQLVEGGRIVIPVGEGDKQIMTVIDKLKGGALKKYELDEFSFVPLLVDKNWEK